MPLLRVSLLKLDKPHFSRCPHPFYLAIRRAGISHPPTSTFPSTVIKRRKFPSILPTQMADHVPIPPSFSPTFGIELEFLFATTVDISNDRQVAQSILDLLTQSVTSTCSLPNCKTRHHLSLRVQVERQLKTSLTATSETYASWSVGRDSSVYPLPDEIDELRAYFPGMTSTWGMEVRSPPFSYVQPGHQPTGTEANTPVLTDDHEPVLTPDWEISRALFLLNSFNNQDDPNLPRRLVWTNRTSGLHVHVGSGVPSRGFSTQTVANLLSLATVFERQLDSVHDTTRIGATTLSLAPIGRLNHSNSIARQSQWPDNPIFCHPLSYHHACRTYECKQADAHGQGPSLSMLPFAETYWNSAYRQHDPELRSASAMMTTLGWMTVVQGIRSFYDLQLLFAGGQLKFTTVNILPLDKPSMGTVEFRQHIGTLHFDEIAPWIDTVVAMVHWSHRVGNSAGRVLEDRWQDLDLTIVDVLQLIDAPSRAIDHYQRVITPSSSASADYSNAGTRFAEVMGRRRQRTPQLTPADGLPIPRFHLPAVSDRIYAKLLAGGYGLYPASALTVFSGRPSLLDADTALTILASEYERQMQETLNHQRQRRRQRPVKVEDLLSPCSSPTFPFAR